MRSFFIIFFFTWLLNLFLPWWSTVLPALIIGAWLLDHWLHAFLIGFSGAGSGWFIQAFYIHVMNEGILAERIANLLQVQTPENVLLATFLVGGLLGGVASAAGLLFRQALNPETVSSS